MGNLYTKTNAAGQTVLIAQATTPDGRRLTKTCANKRAAKAWIAQIENQASVAPVTSPPILLTPVSAATPFHRSITLAQVIDRYAKEIMPSKRSQRAPLQQLETWKALLGHLELTTITPELIARAKSELMSHCRHKGYSRSPATINRYLAILSHVFTVAMKEWFLVSDNPVLKIKKLKEPRGRDVFLSTEERKQLMESLEPESMMIKTIIQLALYTGMRQAEIMGLRWRQVDLEHHRIRLEMTKNGRARGVPVVGPGWQALEDWSRLYRGELPALLFPSPDNTERPFDIRRAWNRIRNRMHMPTLRFHDLRHCTASYMAMSGASPSEMAQVLGHRSLSMVARYAHLHDDHARSTLEKMAEKIMKEDKKSES